MIKNRIWEIDALRGLCILLMICFHTMYDLYFFYNGALNITTPLWKFIANLIAGTFIFVSGISSNFSKNSLKRGLIVIGCGFIITVVTYIWNMNEFVLFGILQFLGVSMILSHVIKKYKLLQNKPFTAAIILLIMITGIAFSHFSVNIHWLIPLGLMPSDFSSIDYFPLLPWFSVFLFGMYAGLRFYEKRESRLTVKHKPKMLMSIGKYSLYIYLLHQPIILGILNLIYKGSIV